jgi:hypothetical protein
MVESPPRFGWRALVLGKEPGFPDETEDAFAGNLAAGRFAVADGASASAFAGPWARMLAESFVESDKHWSVWLRRARQRWQKECQHNQLPWYLDEGFADGAFATLTGVTFDERRTRWQATAVGDSCLFHVRGQRLRQAFPIRRRADFNQTPALLGSRAGPRGKRTKRLRVEAAWQKGDVMLLATDALSEWFLGEIESGKEPWTELLALEKRGEFAAWVGARRESRQIAADDVTLLVIESRL